MRYELIAQYLDNKGIRGRGVILNINKSINRIILTH